MMWRHVHRGQRGLTIVELMLFVAVGSFILVPLFGLLNFTLLRQKPTAEAAEASKELRLFRGALSDDWAEAEVLRVNLADPVAYQLGCSNGPGATNNADTKISIQKSDDNRRVLYKLVANSNPNRGPFELRRDECRHVNWLNLGSPIDGSVQSVSDVVVSRVSELVLPSVCNLEPPFAPCDMNVTLVLANGDRTSLRLHQPVGRRS